jgi:hypothetical protein
MKTTKEVAYELNIKPAALRQHIAAGNILTPKRRAGLMYLWTSKEIEIARQVLSEPGRRQPRYVSRALYTGVGNE